MADSTGIRHCDRYICICVSPFIRHTSQSFLWECGPGLRWGLPKLLLLISPLDRNGICWNHALTPMNQLHIRRIQKFLSQEATCMIIHAFITSQIDYCNSLMDGLPENLIKKLQRVQNTAARLVFNLRKYDRITPALVTLNWLPVKYRIEFKTLLIVFKGLHDKSPTYIKEMITPSKGKRYSIRSNEERVLKVPKFKHDTLASVHSQCMGLWHGTACQRKLGYAMKLKHSSET